MTDFKYITVSLTLKLSSAQRSMMGIRDGVDDLIVLGRAAHDGIVAACSPVNDASFVAVSAIRKDEL